MARMVGETGFEPATLCSQSRCATRLRYSPIARPLGRIVMLANPPDRLRVAMVGPAGFEPAT
jgi:hypothetical protein